MQYSEEVFESQANRVAQEVQVFWKTSHKVCVLWALLTSFVSQLSISWASLGHREGIISQLFGNHLAIICLLHFS